MISNEEEPNLFARRLRPNVMLEPIDLRT